MLGHFLKEMIIIYMMGMIGFVMRKTNILPKPTNAVLTQLILYMTLPALILFSLDISISWSLVTAFFWLVLMSIYVLVASIFLALSMRKKAHLPDSQKSVYESLMIFGNQGFIGYAVSYLLLQEEGIIYVTIFNICYLILIWTYGIFLFTKQSKTIDWKQIFLNPGILATTVGVMLMFSPLSWPNIIAVPLENIGKMTIPLSMILIGSLIAEVNFDNIRQWLKNKYIWNATVIRLIFIPSLLIPFMFFPIALPILMNAIIVSGMPSAPTISLYAQRFGGDSGFASFGVLLSTILCTITIPFFVFLLQLTY